MKCMLPSELIVATAWQLALCHAPHLGQMRSDFLGEEDGRLDIDVQDLLNGAVWHVQDEASCWVDSCVGHQHVHSAIRVPSELHQPLQVLLLADICCAADDLDAAGLKLSESLIHIGLSGGAILCLSHESVALMLDEACVALSKLI